MILLFGEKASKSTGKRVNIKNNPVENSGILANRGKSVVSVLDANEYDIYIFSQQAEIDYSDYSDNLAFGGEIGYNSDYSTALSFVEGCFSDSSFSSLSGGDCSGYCGSFASVC